MTYEQAVAYLKTTYDQAIRLGLERMEELLEKLGNPQNGLRLIHVAGTNGKGSVCAMTARILTCAGYRTGLFTSPVISDYREQFQIDGQMIQKQELIRFTQQVKAVCDQMEDPPSEFEKAAALAFCYFAAQHCDIVVLEVGLGGADDATNVIRTPEVAAIVNIDYDHMGFLGNTLEQITEKKAGIIKEGGSVVIADQRPEVFRVLDRRCQQMHAEPVKVDLSELRIQEKSLDGQRILYKSRTNHFTHEVELSLLGEHQGGNAAVVLEIIDCLRAKGYEIGEAAVCTGLKTVHWPGRFEIVSKDPVIILDGAHNPDGIEALYQNLNVYLKGQKFLFLTGILKDKDYRAMLRRMIPLAHSFITVAPDNPRAMTAKACAQAIRDCGFDGTVMAAEDKKQAVTLAVHEAGDKYPICAFGSLYSIGAFKQAIEEKKNGSGKD